MPDSRVPRVSSGSSEEFESSPVSLAIALPIAAILLAWRNVARRRGAFRGAFRFRQRVPITLDRSSWYFGDSMMALLFLAAIAIFGFISSTAGRQRFPQLAFEG